jgi:uncharacterized phiE125 gp8 family phage protein
MPHPVHRAWTRTADPAEEPVSLVEAKTHLRVDHVDEDALIGSLIVAARQHVEERSGRALTTQTWVYRADAFPWAADAIRLPRPPLRSVTSIEYVGGDGATVTWGAANYRVDHASEPARISPAHGASWPTPQEVTNAVTITYTAGYGTAVDVPEAIRQAMLLLIGHWYANREAVVIGTITKAMEFAVDALLAPYRIIHFGD